MMMVVFVYRVYDFFFSQPPQTHHHNHIYKPLPNRSPQPPIKTSSQPREFLFYSVFYIYSISWRSWLLLLLLSAADPRSFDRSAVDGAARSPGAGLATYFPLTSFSSFFSSLSSSSAYTSFSPSSFSSSFFTCPLVPCHYGRVNMSARPTSQVSQYACEPCRKAKTRCDFSLPVCQKCIRKGRADRCSYVDPSTSARTWYSDNDMAAMAAGAPEPYQPAPQHQQHMQAEPASYGPPVVDLAARMPLHTRVGSLGLASFGGVFSENLDALGRSANVNGVMPNPSAFSTSAGITDSKVMQLGARLLYLLFENLPLYERVARASLESIMEGCVLGESMVNTMFAYLGEMRDSWTGYSKDASDKYNSLIGWSQRVFGNGRKALVVSPTTSPYEYFRSVADRWEGIGLLFAIIGQGAMLERDWRSIHRQFPDSPRDQTSLGVLAAAGAEACLQLCDNFGSEDDPLGWLLFQHIRLLMLVYGDNGRFSVYRLPNCLQC